MDPPIREVSDRLLPNRRSAWAVALAATAAGALACGPGTPYRIVVAQDTVVINSTEWTQLDIRLFDARGRQVRDAHVELTPPATPRMAIRDDGAVNCQSDGVGVILLRADAVRARVTVRCHLIRRFGPPAAVRLVAGGPPVPFAVQAFDEAGRLMPEFHLRASIDDTSIVILRDGLVYGRRPGVSGVRLRSAGEEGGEVFFVEAPPADTIRTVPRRPSDR